jgi:predicted phosphodiesterase
VALHIGTARLPAVPQDLTIAVLTDVHGNAQAAEAVITDIYRCQPDLIVNLGDQVWGQANPERALALQRALGAVEVRGNNDERLMLPLDQLSLAHLRLQGWLAERLPLSERIRLANLPLTALIAEGTVLAAHGTPASPWDSLILGWDGQTYWHRTEQEIQDRLHVADQVEVVLVGHMHRAAVRDLKGRLLVSVGAVSYQNDGDPRARWALLTRRQGRWAVEQRQVAYDHQAAATWLLSNQPVDPSEAQLHLQPVTDFFQ